MKTQVRPSKNHKEFLPYDYIDVNDQFHAPDVLATRRIQ
jgi:hypothetical protein